MNTRILLSVCGWLLLVGLFLAAGWAAYRDMQPPRDAWSLDRTEQVLSGVSADQEVMAAFRLTNTSRQPLRILGGVAC